MGEQATSFLSTRIELQLGVWRRRAGPYRCYHLHSTGESDPTTTILFWTRTEQLNEDQREECHGFSK